MQRPAIEAGDFEPAYLSLLASGELDERARVATRHLESCDLCARYCRVNRKESIRGAVCRTGERAQVDGAFPHFGEEACLTGWAGSGTIFFAWCNLRCVYCQNWELSWGGAGRKVGPEELAGTMLALQGAGGHNVNLVSPSHVVAQVLAALPIAARAGLRLPLVYNTGGFDSPEALALLEGVVDVYMPDVKYADPGLARRYSHVRDYVSANRAAVREMHRQVGDLVIDRGGIARRGLLLRLSLAITGSRACELCGLVGTPQLHYRGRRPHARPSRRRGLQEVEFVVLREKTRETTPAAIVGTRLRSSPRVAVMKASNFRLGDNAAKFRWFYRP